MGFYTPALFLASGQRASGEQGESATPSP